MSRTGDAGLVLARIVQDLIRTVGDENDALTAGKPMAHAGIAARKLVLLRELMTEIKAGESHLGLASDVEHLRQVLKRNSRLLKLHIDALGDVAGIIIDCMKQSESDGTYSKSHLRAMSQKC